MGMGEVFAGSPFYSYILSDVIRIIVQKEKTDLDAVVSGMFFSIQNNGVLEKDKVSFVQSGTIVRITGSVKLVQSCAIQKKYELFKNRFHFVLK